MTHNTLKIKTMIALQKKYKGRIRLFGRSVGLAYFKRGKTFIGPYKIGERGLSDIYGSLSFSNNKIKICLSFSIEIKSGKDQLSHEQKKHKKISESLGELFVVGKDVSQVCQDFDTWEKSIKEKLNGT